MAQDCLADVLRASERKITVEEIQRKVSEHYNIRLSDMIGPKRLRTYARPRQIAMFLSKQLTSRSLPEIGRRFGGSCLLYTSPSPRDRTRSRMPSSA